MELTPDQLKEWVVRAFHDPEFIIFDNDLKRLHWKVSKSISVLAWVMSENKESEAYTYAKMFDHLYRSWDKLKTSYEALAPRGSDVTIDGSFMAEFAEKILRPKFFLLQLPWSNYDPETMQALAKVLDRQFSPGRR